MRFLAGLACFIVMGCDSPSPALRAGVAHQLERGGYQMTVWHKGTRAEVIRHGFAPPGQHERLRALMLQAIIDVTGCTPRADGVDGDSGVLRAILVCEGAQ